VNDKSMRVATGVRIAMLRKSKGWTQAKLSEITHLSMSTISRVESGSQYLTLSGLFRVAFALDVEPAKLLPDLDDIKNALKAR